MTKFSIFKPAMRFAATGKPTFLQPKTYVRLLVLVTLALFISAFTNRFSNHATPTKKGNNINHVLSGGDFSLDFVGAAPFSYSHATGGGAFDDRTIGKDLDVVESLEGGDFTCGDIVTYLTKIKVADNATGSQTIAIDYSFLANTTGQSGAAHDQIVNVAVNYGAVSGGDGTGGTDNAIHDDAGSTATLDIVGGTLNGTLFSAAATLTGTVTVDDLEAGETIVVRVDVHIACQPGSSPTGNLQAAVSGARVTQSVPDNINVGNQTVPFKKIGSLIFPECSITPRDAVCSGTVTSHTATSDVEGSTFNWTISGNGLFAGGSNAFSETPSGTTSHVEVTAGAAGTYTLGVEISKEGFGTTTCAQTITVNETPILHITNPAAICAPGTVDLTAAAVTVGSTIPAGSVLNYYESDGTTIVQNPAAVGSGTYYIEAVTNATPACADKQPVTVTVNAKPTLVVSNLSNTCPSETVNLSTAINQASSILPSGTTFNYFTNDGITPVNNVTAVGAGTYYIEAVTNTTPSCSDKKAVTVAINTCFDGCTPGYWKNRKLSWNSVTYIKNGVSVVRDVRGCVVNAANPVTRLTPMVTPTELKNALFKDVFDLTETQVKQRLGNAYGSITLIQALGLGDGSGFTQLGRAGTAALLNSCALVYPYSSESIVASVKAKFTSSIATTSALTAARAAALQLAILYDSKNNLLCNLNNSTTALTSRMQAGGGLQEEVTKLSVTTYPNPYRNTIRFDIANPQAGQGSLDVYTLLGQKVKTVYQGFIPAGRQHYQLQLPSAPAGTLIYRLHVGTQQVTGKVVHLKE